MAGAKRVHQVIISGELDANSLQIVYLDKERGERTINLRDVLKKFHGCEVSFSLKETEDLPALEDEGIDDN